MRLQRSVLYILLTATCISIWLAMKCSSGPLIQTLYDRTVCSGVGVSQSNAKTREFISEEITSHTTHSQPFYKDHDPEKPIHATLVDDHKDYFMTSGQSRCLIEGTANVSSVCVCKKGWHGVVCSYPDILDETKFTRLEKLHVRDGVPRRIIYGITFNVEFEMLEIRLKDAGDLIDLIVVLESNYTGFGESKGLYLLDKMKRRFLQKYQSKILYLYLNYFPTGPDPKDGAYTDFYMKSYPRKEGLRRISGTRKDDIFIFADADELHRREALLFLKLHDGYPEPVGAYLRRNVFGYYWCSGESLFGIGCSLDMLESVYKNRCGEIREATSRMHSFVSELNDYQKKGNYVQMWQFGHHGSVNNIGGWHCSWCMGPEKIRVKLLSAFNYGFPRWGSYPEKTKLDYIKDLIKVGLWFDEKSVFKPQYIGLHDPYAPLYVLNNMGKFKNLLFSPYRKLKTGM